MKLRKFNNGRLSLEITQTNLIGLQMLLGRDIYCHKNRILYDISFSDRICLKLNQSILGAFQAHAEGEILSIDSAIPERVMVILFHDLTDTSNWYQYHLKILLLF